LKKMLFLSVLLFMFPLVSFANDLNEDEGVDSPKFTYEDYNQIFYSINILLQKNILIN